MLTTPALTAIATPAIRWTEVDEHFWTAGSGSVIVGTIEFTEGRFAVRDADGVLVGGSHSLGGAKALLQGGAPTEAVPSEFFADARVASLPIVATAATFLALSAVAAGALAIQLFA